MKRLAAIAVVVAMSALPACAQHGGGSHGGFSGSHSGGSGFSGGHGGFSAPAFRGATGAFVGSGPPRFAGGRPSQRNFYPQAPSARPPFRYGGPVPGSGVRPPQYASNPVTYPGRMPYPGRGAAPISSAPHQFNTGTSQRMPYHSSYSGARGDHAWNHGGGGHDHDGGHHHVTVVGVYGWAGYPNVYGWAGYPYWPWWGWNYPILPASWDYRNDNDAQPASNYPEYMPGPYDTYPSKQPEPNQPEYTPQPYSSPAPPAIQPGSAAPAPPEAPVTLVFKDGRPNEQIQNYLLTSTTLSVLDQRRRDIPVDQLDVPATARLNRKAGVEFSLPSGGR